MASWQNRPEHAELVPMCFVDSELLWLPRFPQEKHAVGNCSLLKHRSSSFQRERSDYFTETSHLSEFSHRRRLLVTATLVQPCSVTSFPPIQSSKHHELHARRAAVPYRVRVPTVPDSRARAPIALDWTDPRQLTNTPLASLRTIQGRQ